MYSNKENINILTSLLVEYGIKHVVICPGSRNAPIAHNLSVCPDFVCHQVTDERSAGFYALGMAQQLKSPVAVCVTSGSALLNVLPAVAEATYQNNGILVISADRPSSWIGQLDGQTMPQKDALGPFVGKSVNLPEPKDDVERWYCNRLVNEALIKLQSNSRPSVHINVPISEPLYTFDVKELPEERAIETSLAFNLDGVEFFWGEHDSKDLVRCSDVRDAMIVIGQTDELVCPSELAEKLSSHFAVLTEPLSSSFRSFTEELIRVYGNKLKPDLVIYLGGNTISKPLRRYLRSLGNATLQVVVSSDDELHDVSQNTEVFLGRVNYRKFLTELADAFKTEDGYRSNDNDFASMVRGYRQKVEAVSSNVKVDYSGLLAVKMLEKKCSDNIVYYANSLSVRYGAIAAKGFRYCNRGLNGIEGLLSAAAGASLVSGNKLVYAVIGDLSFFYDENALWPSELSGKLRILLLNNGGGAIFSGIKGAKESSAFERFISASQNLSAEGICRQFGVRYLVAKDVTSLETGIETLCQEKSDTPILLEVITDQSHDELIYEQYYKTIEHELETDARI